MRVLLIYPPINTNLPTRGSFPLGLGYLSSKLLGSGHSVTVYDLNIQHRTRKTVAAELQDKCRDHDLIGISGMVTTYGYIKWLVSFLKERIPSVPVVVGGSVASPMPGFVLRHTLADIACVGEGEETITNLAESLENGMDLASVKGIAFRRDDTLVQTPQRELNSELDSIPFPAWDLFQIKRYIKNSYLVKCPSKSMNIIASRGCPYQCTFCYRNFGRSYRYRSVNNVIAEIEALIDRYDVRHFEFQDELFALNDKYVTEFCNELIRRKLAITWRCLGRVNLVDYDVLMLMKEAGCHWLGFGIESGSQAMLDSMKKQTSPEQAANAISLARKAGISVSGTFVIGMPGETKETIKETVEFCKATRVHNTPFFPVPYPGTALYENLKSQGLVNEHNEEEFILKLGRDATNLIINLTDMSDEELVLQKKRAETEIKKHITGARNAGKLLQILTGEYRIWGFLGLMKILLRIASTRIKRVTAC